MATHPRTSTLAGFGTALVLTLAAFALVEMRYFVRQTTFILIGALGVLQILVHFRYFLQLRLRAESRDRILTLAFAAVVAVLMAIGTLWIIADLKRRMMPGHQGGEEQAAHLILRFSPITPAGVPVTAAFARLCTRVGHGQPSGRGRI